MQLKSKLLWFFGFFLLSSGLYASSSTYVAPEHDLSIFYLKSFFGPLVPIEGNAGSEAGIFSIVMKISLQAALLGTVSILAYMTALSTLRGSHEGSLLGKDASSFLTSSRTLLALAILIPRSDGYASLQHLFMWLVLKGIFLANNMWVMIEASKENKLPDTSKILIAPQEAEDLVLSLYKIKTAVEVANQHQKIPYQLEFSSDGMISFVNTQQRMKIAKIPADPVPGLNYERLYLLVDSIMPTEVGLNLLNQKLLIENWENFFQGKMKEDALRVAEYFSSLNKSKKSNSDLGINDMKRKQGWLSAGAYYWDLFADDTDGTTKANLLKKSCASNCLVQSNSLLIDKQKISNILSPQGPGSIASGLTGSVQKINTLFDKFYKDFKKNSRQSSNNVKSSFDNAYKMLDDKVTLLPGLSLDQFLSKDVYEFDLSDSQMSVFKKDRLKILIEKNFSVISRVLTIFAVTIGMAVALQIGGFYKGVYAGITFSLLNMFFFVIFFIFGTAVSFIPPAILGSMYLALIPGIIFFSASLAWFMKVIEAIVLAPIMIVGIMLPTRDEFARIRTIFQNLLVISFKPALMMIGLVIGSKLVNIALLFSSVILSNLFEVVMENFSPGFLGSMLFLGLLFNFSTLLTINLVTRAFGAIYLIPDQVFVSIGVHSEAGDESRDMIMSMQQSARQASQSITGALSLVDSVYKSLANKNKTKEYFSSFSNKKKD